MLTKFRTGYFEITSPIPRYRLDFQTRDHFLFQEGEDPKLKPDEEYPDWLWTLKLENSKVPLEELEYDSQEYWDRLKEYHRKKKNLRTRLMHKYKQY